MDRRRVRCKVALLLTILVIAGTVEIYLKYRLRGSEKNINPNRGGGETGLTYSRY